jgi:hypothetical protein
LGALCLGFLLLGFVLIGAVRIGLIWAFLGLIACLILVLAVGVVADLIALANIGNPLPRQQCKGGLVG